jgi:DNA repair exonuclease SbcCD ATPase subunit
VASIVERERGCLVWPQKVRYIIGVVVALSESVDNLSRADEITSEVRKLVLTCKALEAQLQQSIPKKTHEEEVAKLRAEIEDLQRQVNLTKGELEKTISVGARLGALESRINTLYDVVAAQNEAVKGISEKLAQATVPYSLHTEDLARIQQLEEQVYTMVPRSDVEAIQGELANSVPKAKLEELERSMADTVPKERLAAAEAKISELEAALADTVPRGTMEELKEKIASLMKDAPGVDEETAPPASA